MAHITIFVGIFAGTRDPDYWNETDPPSTSNAQWMSRLPDSKLVSEISVPGTHNSMAREGGPAYWCQSLSIKDQMNRLGIRFFDIRCRHYNADLPIHHMAYYQHSNFYDVLRESTYFVSVFPSEFIFIRVKQEYSSVSDVDFERNVWAHMDNYDQSRFWLRSSIPTVGEARGKVILLRDFDTRYSESGISYNSLHIADDYRANYNSKWSGVQRNLERAQSGPRSSLYLTFNSDSLLAPRDMARKLNTWLHDYVRGRQGRMGIIAMDYPGLDRS